VAETRILSVIGGKGAGKTTLVVALAAEFVRKGRRVMTIGPGNPPVSRRTDPQDPFFDGKVERALVIAPEYGLLYLRSPDLKDPVALARTHLQGADLVIVEGFPEAPLPKIEVFRRGSGRTPLYDPAASNASEWLAIVTDEDRFEAPVPVLRFHDTMWLHLLANMAWDRARPL